MSDIRHRAEGMLALFRSDRREPARWRVSPDLGSRMVQPAVALDEEPSAANTMMMPVYELKAPWGDYPARWRMPGPPEIYLGVPVLVDETLPPNALMLDAVTDHRDYVADPPRTE